MGNSGNQYVDRWSAVANISCIQIGFCIWSDVITAYNMF